MAQTKWKTTEPLALAGGSCAKIAKRIGNLTPGARIASFRTLWTKLKCRKSKTSQSPTAEPARDVGQLTSLTTRTSCQNANPVRRHLRQCIPSGRAKHGSCAWAQSPKSSTSMRYHDFPVVKQLRGWRVMLLQQPSWLSNRSDCGTS